SAQRADAPALQGGQRGQIAIVLSDAEVAGMLRAANLAELEYSQMGCAEATAVEVQGFAEAMIAHHIEALTREGEIFQQNNIVPVQSEHGSAFVAEMDGLFEEANDAQGEDFDVEFMAGQVEFHLVLLDIVDLVLLPAASNEALRGELLAVRGATLEHLQLAYDIHCDLTGQDPGQGPGRSDLIQPDGYALGLYNRELIRSGREVGFNLYDRDLIRRAREIGFSLYNHYLLLQGSKLDLDLEGQGGQGYVDNRPPAGQPGPAVTGFDDDDF
ncbi:MAG TPA: DUF4142 domain-containing protein, partial [Candidatus Nanopelagicales bacterium]|nr:DUF4142 domain-containing protein [Candidatus Nanopelagicales bacterium]